MHSPHIFAYFQCIDLGYHNTLARAMMSHISADNNLVNSKQSCLTLLNKCVTELDQRSDKQLFLENNNQAFSLPRKFEFQAHKGDEVCGVLRMLFKSKVPQYILN